MVKVIYSYPNTVNDIKLGESHGQRILSIVAVERNENSVKGQDKINLYSILSHM
jgi:hypothetical protein